MLPFFIVCSRFHLILSKYVFALIFLPDCTLKPDSMLARHFRRPPYEVKGLLLLSNVFFYSMDLNIYLYTNILSFSTPLRQDKKDFFITIIVSHRKELRSLLIIGNLAPLTLRSTKHSLRRPLLQYAGPVLVCLLNVAWNILFPLSLDILAAIQVELAIDDLPDRWICLCDAPHRNPIGSVSAILWGIGLRIRLEQIKMFSAGKTPCCPHPFVSEFF